MLSKDELDFYIDHILLECDTDGDDRLCFTEFYRVIARCTDFIKNFTVSLY